MSGTQNIWELQLTVFGLFKADTNYFDLSSLNSMINFITDDLAAFRSQLLHEGACQATKVR